MNKSQADISEKQPPQKIIYFLEILQKLLTTFFIFTLPVVFYVLNTDMSYPKVIYSFVMISLLLVLWGVQSWLQREFRLHLPTLFWPGVLLILAGAFSAINATSLGIVLQSLATLVYFFLFYVYIANTAKGTHTFYLYFGAAALSLLPIVVYVLFQKYGIMVGGSINTLIGTMGNPVAVAQYLDGMLIVGLLLFIGHVSIWMKVLFLSIFTVGLGVLFATDTTGPLLSLIASFGLFALGLTVFRKTFLSLMKIKGWLVAMLLMGALSLVIIGQPTWSPLRLGHAPERNEMAGPHKILDLTTQTNMATLALPVYKQIDNLIEIWQENSGELRAYYWLVGLEMFKAQPLFGVGLGHYKVLYTTYGAKLIPTPFGQKIQQQLMEIREEKPEANLSPTRAHNEYVQVIAETGILGITSVVLMLAMLLWSGLRKLRTEHSPKKQLIFLLLYVGVFTFVADSLFNFPGHLPAASMNLILLLGLAHSRYLFPQATIFQLKRWWRHGLAVALIVMCVSISVIAYQDWQANLKLELGKEYLTNGLSISAQEFFEQSLSLDFQPSEALYYLGLIHLEQNQTDVAKDYFERSLRTRVFEDTLWKLANLNFQDQNYTEAGNYLNQLRALFPNPDTFLEMRYLEALIEIRLGNTEKSIEISQETLQDYPEFGQMYLALGEAALSTQDYESAFDAYRQSVVYLNELIDELILFINQEENVSEVVGQQLRQLQFQRDEVVKILDQLAQVVDR